MRIFVTGASGFVGSAVVNELISAGHEVLGLARSDASAAALIAAGAEVHRGSLEDIDSLKRGAAEADGVIHTAFNHDFSRFAQNCEDDRRVIEALGSVLAGSDRPLIVTSGTGLDVPPGHAATEEDPHLPASVVPRAASEEGADAALAAGANVSVVRLPQVHNTIRQGLVSYTIAIAREKQQAAYVGDGSNRWSAVHLLDAARVYRLAIEKAQRGAKYHAIAEEGVANRDIAEVVGRQLKVPVVSIAAEKAAAYFGWLAAFAARDMPASSALTRKRLGWQPVGPGLLADLERLQLATG
ncbi:MAG: SDR family oxidoreductase [Rudaea sp.]|uniref:SDR family oxidoreductase n=1 Tax=unclassified Rudaea TaxID=2627037 RepID=UPI0010F753DB|nr:MULTISPECIES: SDR family oxidoreductase [unclassified Rudaea]MBN8887619.1 SDR family oxidoreductase [Rudaea sp.]MBR0347238.1 SDR family oxidoreductase [Rudaea sp.]